MTDLPTEIDAEELSEIKEIVSQTIFAPLAGDENFIQLVLELKEEYRVADGEKSAEIYECENAILRAAEDIDGVRADATYSLAKLTKLLKERVAEENTHRRMGEVVKASIAANFVNHIPRADWVSRSKGKDYCPKTAKDLVIESAIGNYFQHVKMSLEEGMSDSEQSEVLNRLNLLDNIVELAEQYTQENLAQKMGLFVDETQPLEQIKEYLDQALKENRCTQQEYEHELAMLDGTDWPSIKEVLNNRDKYYIKEDCPVYICDFRARIIRAITEAKTGQPYDKNVVIPDEMIEEAEEALCDFVNKADAYVDSCLAGRVNAVGRGGQ